MYRWISTNTKVQNFGTICWTLQHKFWLFNWKNISAPYQKNVFSLKELSKSFISSYVDKFDELVVPATLKKELTKDFSKHHDHFEVILNEKEAIWKMTGGNYEHLGFNISKGNGKVVTYLISFSSFQLSKKFC